MDFRINKFFLSSCVHMYICVRIVILPSKLQHLVLNYSTSFRTMYKIDEMLNGSDCAKYLKSANKLGCVISTNIFQNLRLDSAHLIFNILISLLIFWLLLASFLAFTTTFCLISRNDLIKLFFVKVWWFCKEYYHVSAISWIWMPVCQTNTVWVYYHW